METNDLSKVDLERLAGLVVAQMRANPLETPNEPPPRAPASRKNKNPDRVKYLTDDEIAALFRAIAMAKSARDLAIFELAYHRGLRASEVGLLQRADVRLSSTSRRIYVRRLKNGNSGENYMTDREVRALKPYLRLRGESPGALFPSRKRSPISRKRLDALMRLYGAAAGLPPDKRHFHALRHSCAVALLERDEPIELVMDHLGHKDIRNTMIYAKISNRKRLAKDQRLAKDW